MSIYLEANSGMGNRIIPIISAMRLSKKYNKPLLVHWSNGPIGRYVESKYVKQWTGRRPSFHDFFEPVEGVKFISQSAFNKARNQSRFYTNEKRIVCTVQEVDLSDPNTNVLFSRVWFPFASKKDEEYLKVYSPYPQTLVSSNEFLEDLRKFAKTLVPVKTIQDKIDETMKDFGERMLGVHIRKTNGGFLHKDFSGVKPKIDAFLKCNPEYKIYLAADNIDTENEYKSYYGDKLVVYSNPINGYANKGSNTVAGVQNGIVEMLLLSKCDRLFGTGESSFSFGAWLFSDQDSYDIHTA